jgi:hypothetical protein
MEDTPMKALYAVAFALWSFAACAQNSDASTVVLFDFDDYFGELTDVITIPSQSTSGQSVSEKSAEVSSETQGLTIRGDNEVEDEAVAAIRPSDKSAYVESPIWWGDISATEYMMDTTTITAQIEAPEPTLDRSAYVESPVWWGDELAIEDVIDTTTKPAQINTREMDRSTSVQPPIWWDDKLAKEDMVEETGTAEHSTLTDNELRLHEAMDVPLAGIEPSHEPAMESSNPREDKRIVSEVSAISTHGTDWAD